jgi:hypothetical protein
VGSCRLHERLLERATLSGNRQTDYALGVTIENFRGLKLYTHGGQLYGLNAFVLAAPDLKLDIAFVLNRETPIAMTLCEEILSFLVPVLASKLQVSSKRIRGNFIGKHSGRVVELDIRNNRQFACVDGWDLEYRYERSQGAFVPASDWSTMRRSILPMGGGDTPRSILFTEFERGEELVCCAVAADARTALESGRFYCADFDTWLDWRSANDESSIITSNRFGSREFLVTRLSAEVWRAKSKANAAGLILSFESDASAVNIRNYSFERPLRFERR